MAVIVGQDIVDAVAVTCVGGALRSDPPEMRALLDDWIDDDDMWRRRTALLSQLKHKDATDKDRLFTYCLVSAPDTEFFIRKAIGWALREYAKTDPEAVGTFLIENKDQLSGLSYREGGKHLSLS